MVLDNDVDFALLLTSVLDIVLTVVGISDLTWDILWLLLTSGDSHLELVPTRGTILFVLIPGLDDELNIVLGGELGQDSWSIAESLVWLGVQEERVVHIGGRHVSSLDGQLHNCLSLVAKDGKVWGGRSDLSL